MRNNYNKLTWKMKSTVKQIPRINNWDVCKEIKKSVQRNKQSICSGITLSCTRPCNTHAGVSQWLVKHGFTITLSNTEYNHRQVTLKFEVKFRRCFKFLEFVKSYESFLIDFRMMILISIRYI